MDPSKFTVRGSESVRVHTGRLVSRPQPRVLERVERITLARPSRFFDYSLGFHWICIGLTGVVGLIDEAHPSPENSGIQNWNAPNKMSRK